MMIADELNIDQDALQLIRSYDATNQDRLRLYGTGGILTDPEKAYLVISKTKDNRYFYLYDVIDVTETISNLNHYVYTEDDQDVHIFYGYNTDYETITLTENQYHEFDVLKENYVLTQYAVDHDTNVQVDYS